MGNVMSAADLYSVVNTVQNFAATDQLAVPALNAVRLEFREDAVLAAATDRFVLGVMRADYAGEAFTVLVSLANIKTLTRMAKTGPRATWRKVEIEPERNEAIDAITAVTFKFTDGESIRVAAVDAQFPKYGRLIPSADDVTGPASVKGFNAALLARFAKVPGRDAMQLVIGDALKPSVVRVGDDFVGLIMPVNLRERGEYVRPEWLDA